MDEYNTSTPVFAETDPTRNGRASTAGSAEPTSLKDHLEWQIRLSDFSDEEREIGACIIGNLDNDGYLDATIEEVVEMSGATPAMVEQVLGRIQTFDPTGVGARDLKECLLVQAKNLDLANQLVVRIIEDHLHYLETKNYAALVRALKRSPEEVKAAVEIILGLDPRPGSAFNKETIEYISPDIYIFRIDDEWVILLNEDGMPKLRVSSYYKDALGEGDSLPAETRDYIQTKLRSAAWLIKSIHQRQRTLYKVSQSIVKLQTDFFEKGWRTSGRWC